MCVPRNPKSVSAIAARLDSLLATTTSFSQTFPSSHLHQVSLPPVKHTNTPDQGRKAESVIAPFLTELQARVKKEGIRVGSCESSYICSCELDIADLVDPMLYQGVHVSLIGHDVSRIEELGKEVSRESTV
jgi:hypothetical protein